MRYLTVEPAEFVEERYRRKTLCILTGGDAASSAVGGKPTAAIVHAPLIECYGKDV